MSYKAIVDGREVSWEEYRDIRIERRKQEYYAREVLKDQALALLHKIGEAYTAYKEFVEDHPEIEMETADEGQNHQFYQQLRENLGHADDAPRCMHVKADGLRCGSPRMKSGDLCFTHQRMANAQSLRLRLSNYDDPNGIQLAIQEVSNAMLDGKITQKEAGLLLYGLQTAASNVARVTFHQAPENMVVEDTKVSAAQQAPTPVATGPVLSNEERYKYENMDPDLRRKFMELGDELDRRELAKKKAAEAAEAAAAATPLGCVSETGWEANEKAVNGS